MMLDSYITLSRVTMTASEVMEASSLLQTAYYWTFFGSALLWDTVQTEAAHRPLVKDIYRKSGKVRLGLLNDLFIRLYRAR